MRRLTRCRNCKRCGLHKEMAKRYRMNGFNKRRFWDRKMSCVIRPYVRLCTQREYLCRYCGKTFLKSHEGIASSFAIYLNHCRYEKHIALCREFPYKPFRLQDYYTENQAESSNGIT